MPFNGVGLETSKTARVTAVMLFQSWEIYNYPARILLLIYKSSSTEQFR